MEVDVEQASAQIDVLIERRSQEREKANELEDMWRRSEKRHREQERRKNRALWYEFHMRLCEAHARIADEHEQRALALLEDPGEGRR